MLTDGAVQQLGQIPYFYNASLGTARFEHLEVRKPSGETRRASAEAIRDTSVQVLPNVMSDLHQLQAAVPGLAPGDVIDYRVVATVTHPQIPGQFWYGHRFTVAAAVTSETLTIDSPSERPLQIKTAAGFEAAPPEGEARKGRRTYRWKSSNPQARELGDALEKAREGRLEPPDVLVTTFRSWEELGRWYLDAARDRDKPDEAIVAKALELTRGLTSPADKLRALYEFVATQCRYLSLSFGMGALVPHKASEVFANRYGDCKDRHTLLAALARAVGIRTYPAIISTTQVLERSLPSPAQTDHMITVGALGPSERDWVWLDSASGSAPFWVLLPALRDKTAVVLVGEATTPAGGGTGEIVRLVTTPAAPPFPCFRRTRVESRLSPVGTLDARASVELRGDDEVPLRAVLRMVSGDGRAEFLKAMASDIQLTGEVVDPEISDPAAARNPLRVAFRVRQEGWFDRSKDKTLDLPVEAMSLPYSREKDWKGKARVRPWSLSEERTVSTTVELPAGFVPKLPIDVTLTRDYAQYRSTHKFDGSRLAVERVLTVKAMELPAERMRDYLAFVAAVRSDETQEIPLDTTKAVPVSAASDATPTELHRTGLSQYDARDYVGAVTTLKRAVELAPNDPDAWDALGVAYDALYRWNDAVRAFQEQVKVEPFHKQAWMHLGWALQRSKRREDAIAAYRKQIEVVPLHKDAHRDLGELLLEDPPDYKEAALELAKAEQITPDDGVVAERLGRALLKAGETANALVAFERARKLSPGAEVESQIALELIDAGVEVDRGVAEVKAALGRAEAESLKLDLATAKPGDAKRSWALSTSWHALGWAAFKKGDFASAQRYLSAARSVRNEADISGHLSLAVEKLGWRTDAIQYAAESLVYAESRPVRERLLRLAGNSEATVAQVLEQARARVLSERTAEYARTSPRAGSIDFVAIFTNGSKQPAVRALTHDAELEPVLAYVRRSSFLLSFPNGTPARVLTEGRLTCAEKGKACFTVLYFGSDLEALATPTSKR